MGDDLRPERGPLLRLSGIIASVVLFVFVLAHYGVPYWEKRRRAQTAAAIEPLVEEAAGLELRLTRLVEELHQTPVPEALVAPCPGKGSAMPLIVRGLFEEEKRSADRFLALRLSSLAFRYLARHTTPSGPRGWRNQNNTYRSTLEAPYIIVFASELVEPPDIGREDELEGGRVRGMASVFDMNTKKPICQRQVESQATVAIWLRQSNARRTQSTRDQSLMDSTVDAFWRAIESTLSLEVLGK